MAEENTRPRMGKVAQLGEFAWVATVAAYASRKIIAQDPEGFAGLEEGVPLVLMGATLFIASRVRDWWASRQTGMREVSIVFLVCLSLAAFPGCGVVVGHARPVQVSDKASEHAPSYGCEMKGIEIAIGQARGCQAEGGALSEVFSSVLSAVVDPAMRIVSGVFGGLSAVSAPDR